MHQIADGGKGLLCVVLNASIGLILLIDLLNHGCIDGEATDHVSVLVSFVALIQLQLTPSSIGLTFLGFETRSADKVECVELVSRLLILLYVLRGGPCTRG